MHADAKLLSQHNADPNIFITRHKNRISHRAKAMQKAWALLSRYLREKSGGRDDTPVPPRRERA